jgi:ABC-type phosphate transport system permease subunit
MAVSPTSLRARERRRTRRDVSDEPTRADRLFGALTSAAGLTVLLLLVLVGLFLLLRSLDAFDVMGWSFFTTVEWNVQGDAAHFGVLGLLIGTVLVALVAVTIAVPLGTCTGLYITDYASPRWRGVLTGLVDLLAAIPSLLYGLWGFLLLDDKIVPLSRWMARHLDWMPWFRVDDNADFTGTIFIAGIVVSSMVLPIVASITREVFSQTPPGEKEAALALGGTAGAWSARWCSRSAGAASSAARCWGWAGPWARPSRWRCCCPGAQGVDPDPPERRGHGLGLHRAAGRRQRPQHLGPHGGRSGAVLDDPADQHAGLGRDRPQPLRRRGRPVAPWPPPRPRRPRHRCATWTPAHAPTPPAPEAAPAPRADRHRHRARWWAARPAPWR